MQSCIKMSEEPIDQPEVGKITLSIRYGTISTADAQSYTAHALPKIAR
jgi:hypothetical protein